MIEICDDAPASVGPEMRFEPPSSFSASSTPECSNSSYGLPSCFGIETVLRPFLISAFGIGAARLDSLDDDELLDDSSSFVAPQAEKASAATQRERGEQHAQGARTDGIDHFGPSSGCWL